MSKTRLIHSGSATGLLVEIIEEHDTYYTVKVLEQKGCWQVGDLVDVDLHQIEYIKD